MKQIWTILKWEYMNRVKTKLFLITTFVLPFFYGRHDVLTSNAHGPRTGRN